VPHEFLLHANRSSHGVSPHLVGVPECVCADMTDARFFSGTIKFPPESSVGVLQSAEFERTGENPIAHKGEAMTAIEREVTEMYAKRMPEYSITAEEVKDFPRQRTVEMKEFATCNNRKFVIWGRPKQ